MNPLQSGHIDDHIETKRPPGRVGTDDALYSAGCAADWSTATGTPIGTPARTPAGSSADTPARTPADTPAGTPAGTPSTSWEAGSVAAVMPAADLR